MARWFGKHPVHDAFDTRERTAVAREARQLQDSAANATLCGFIGIVAGAALTHLLLEEFGPFWPRWSRFVLLMAGAAGTACVLARLANLILALLAPALCAFLILLVAKLLLLTFQ